MKRMERWVKNGMLFVAVLSLTVSTGCTKAARKSKALAAADKDYAAGNYERAEIEYLTALRIPPPSAQGFLQLGRIYYAQGKWPQASACFQKGLELAPEDAEARGRMARALAALGNIKDARKNALQALDKVPGEEQALFALVETTFSTNDMVETEKRLDLVPEHLRSRTEYRVARGAHLIKQGQWEQAEQQLKTAVMEDPKSSQAQFALGNLYLARTNLVQAESHLKAAADLAPARSTVPLKYADYLARIGKREEAKAVAEKLTAATPDLLPAWLFLARLQFDSGNYDACRKLNETVLARDSMNAEAMLLKGDLFLARGEATNAVTQFEKIGAIYGKTPLATYKQALARLENAEVSKALSLLGEAISQDPQYIDALLLKAQLETKTGKAKEAEIGLKSLIARHGELFQAYIALGEAYLAQGDLDDAIETYEKARKLFPKSVDVPLVLGALFVQKGNYGEARKSFEDAALLAPANLLAQEKLIDLDVIERRFEAALKRAQDLQQSKGQIPEPWLFEAKVHTARGLLLAGVTNAQAAASSSTGLLMATNLEAKAEIARAEQPLKKALEIQPSNRVANLMLVQMYQSTGRLQEAVDRLSLLARTNDLSALMQIGLLQTELKHYEAARQAYEKALASSPNLAPVMNNLAFLYAEQLGDLDKAMEYAAKARQLLPNDGRTADTLGWVVFKRGEFDRALGIVQESARLLRGDAEVQYHLGAIQYMRGEEEAARLALAGALKSAPGAEWRKDAEQKLGILDLRIDSMTDSQLGAALAALAERKADPGALLRVAQIKERQGKYGEAADGYEAVLKVYPANVAALVRLAFIYGTKLERTERALEVAKQAHTAAPQNPEATWILGRLAFRTRNYPWALTLLQEAATKISGAELSYDLAWAHYALGHVPEAAASMTNAVTGETLSATQREDARLFLGFLTAAEKFGKEEPGQTAVDFEQCLVKRAGYVPALQVKAMSQQAHGDFTGAGATYQQILSAFPLFTPAMIRLAGLYAFHLSNDKGGFEMASKARELAPGDPDVAGTLGVLHYRRKEYDRAIQLLSESLRTAPENGQVQYYLGMAHCQLKQTAEGKKALQRAIDLKVDPKLAEEARKILQQAG